MSYRDRVIMDQRLVILRALEHENDGRLNESLIGTVLEQFGHVLSREQVREQLNWLRDADAIRIEMPGGVIMVAEITRRGADHVERRGDPIEGVAVPSRI